MECEFPKLRLLHAIPNGGHRQMGTAVKLQKEGALALAFQICSCRWQSVAITVCIYN
jgi:hypothetical protein